MMLALSVLTTPTQQGLFEHYDNAIINGSFDAESDRAAQYDQRTRIGALARPGVLHTGQPQHVRPGAEVRGIEEMVRPRPPRRPEDLRRP